MMQEGLKHFTEIPLTVVGMLIFFVTYMAVLVFVLGHKKVKQRMDLCAEIPLREDEHHE